MSDETAQALARAEEELNEMINRVDGAKGKFLEGVASEIPLRVEGILKKAAQEQPEVTKALGREGIAALRADLAREAGEVAAGLLNAAPAIQWPIASGWGASTSDVASALTKHLETDSLSAIFHTAGYGISVNRRTGISSSQLVDSRTPRFEQLMEVLRDLEDARRTVAEARKADDAAIVADIWGE